MMTSGTNDTKKIKEIMGNRLQKARKERGLNRNQFAEFINKQSGRPIINGQEDTISSERLKQWEYGNNPINLEWIPIICKVLKCDVGYLFGEYEEKQRVHADACEITGLSEESIKTLCDMNNDEYGDLGVGVFRDGNQWVVPTISVIDDLIKSDKMCDFTNAIGLYYFYATGVIMKTVQNPPELSPDEFLKVHRWADANNLRIISKNEVCDLYLQRACDAIKNIFRDKVKKGIDYVEKE